MASSLDASPSNDATKTPAQILAEQHAAHHATVEEVVDEEEIQHPPPSSKPNATSDATTNGTNGVMSEKAAGKRKEADRPGKVLDTQDEEAFPSLGPASKPTTAAPGWGAKPSFKAAASSGASAPTSSGTTAPTSGRPAGRAAPGAVQLPGRGRDYIDIENADIDKTKFFDKVLADAKRKYRVNTGVQEVNYGKARRFWAEGPQQSTVRQALMEISKAVSLEQRVRIPIPATVSSSIIGKQGSNIKRLQQEHGVKIQIDRDQSGPDASPDQPRIDVVEVRGDAAAVRVVSSKINEQVKLQQPKVDMPLRGIPPEFYPFLAGRHAGEIQKLEQDNDLQIKIPEYHTWQQQPPPRPSRPDAPPSFASHGDSHIVLSGDQAAAINVRAAIEQLAQQLQEELLLEELTCEQVMHPYIVGNRGMDPLLFLEKTGCAVILPPSHQETDDIHIIGPSDKLEAGRNLAEQLMAEKHNRPVDLRKQFADAPFGPERHSRALAQYLQRKALEEEFMNSHSAEIVFPTSPDAAASWSVIASDPQKAVSAKNDLMKIVSAFPTPRIQLVEIDPFFHPHLAEMHAHKFRSEHGVHLIVPDVSEDPVILVYEGPAQGAPAGFPRQRPTSPEMKEIERALREVQAQLMASLPSEEVGVENLEVPRKFHDRLRRFVKSEQQPSAPATFPVQVEYGTPRSTGRTQQTQGAVPDAVFLRGPSGADIAALKAKIEQFIVEAEQDEKERGFTTEMPFPEKYVKNLVGKNGANIKAIREKHDVEIDTRENGKVKIQGPQKKAEACKAEIARLAKQYEDEVNFTIKVDPKFHGEMIGKNGENLHRLQEKVNGEVRIDFPRVSKGGDNANGNDAASDAGGTQRQAPDEIKLRGPRAKAEKIREELLSLAQYLQDNAYSATVLVARDQVRSLIGRAGAEMEKLRLDTGAQIDVPNRGAEGDRVAITIKGTKQAVEKATGEIQKRSRAFDAVVTKNITVDRKHHKDLIGAKGSNIQRIVVSAGGPERSAEAVQFPKQGDESNSLSVRGTEDVVAKIVAAIEKFVEEKDSQTTESFDVPVDQHRLLIGREGNIRKSIEEQFSVTLDVPKRDSGKTAVKITGRSENVAKAKQHVVKLTKQPEGVTIMVPRSLHHTVANEGRLFRDLRSQGIKVDHRGQRAPTHSQRDGAQRSRPVNGDLPLITDVATHSQPFSFEVVPLNQGGDAETGDIPWVLTGGRDTSEQALAKAQKNIEEAMEQAREPKHVGYLRLADPRLHRHVIGSRGATINSIRRETGCDIQVPGGNKGPADQGEEITITGSEEGIESARDLILQEIKKATT